MNPMIRSTALVRPKAARNQGFSLIELMVAVAIVAVLAGLAYPSYTRYVDRARRSDASDILMQIAAQQERNYSRNASYTDTASLGYTVSAGWAATAEGTYRFQVAAATVACPIATCYLLVAEPTGVQARDQWQFRLSSTGQRTSRKGSSGAWSGGWPER